MILNVTKFGNISSSGLKNNLICLQLLRQNMILRGDGKVTLKTKTFYAKILVASAKTMQRWYDDPPYSMGSSANTELYEINFTEHLLNSLVEGTKAVVIVPQSHLHRKTKFEKETKQNILKHHTLEVLSHLIKYLLWRRNKPLYCSIYSWYTTSSGKRMQIYQL